MIIRAQTVMTMDGPPIENGAVVVSRDRIAEIGTFSEVSKHHSREKTVDLGEQALLPGLINAHCHLDYTCLRGKIPRQESFTDWIRAINGEKARLGPEDYIASLNDGFLEAKRFGTTTIANLTGLPELISRIKTPIRTWWFPELIDIRQQISPQNLNALCIEVGKVAAHWGLAPHAPFTASADLYERCEEIARRENILLTTHLAESREEMEMFEKAEGPLYEFLKKIGRNMSDCGEMTPVGHFLSKSDCSQSPAGGSVNRSYLFAHLNELSGSDFDWLKKSVPATSIVHCPRSHEYFGHSPFQFQRLRDLGLNICLGTDSLASNEDLSLFAEMRAFQKKFSDVAAKEILEMTTTNAARALGQESALGKIRPGFMADLIAVPIEKSTSIFERIIGFDGAVNWLMVNGQILA